MAKAYQHHWANLQLWKPAPFAVLLLVAAIPLVASAESSSAEPNTCRALVSKLVDEDLARLPAQKVRQEKSWLGFFLKDQRPAEPSREQDAEAPPQGNFSQDESANTSDKTAKADAPSALSEGTLGRRGAAGGDTSSQPPLPADVLSTKKAKEGPRTYSRTNTQELSVDEGDIVKTDGQTIYHVTCDRVGEASGCRNEIRIFSSWPAKETKLLSRFAVPQRNGMPSIRQIYLHDQKVVVLMNEVNPRGARTEAEIAQLGKLGALNIDAQTTRVLLLDVRDPRNPMLVREVDLEGAFIDSRMIGSRLYLATNSPGLQLPSLMMQEIHTMLPELMKNGERPTAATVLAKLDSKWDHFINRDPGLPHALSLNAPQSNPAYTCADVNAGNTVSNTRLLNVVQLDMATSAVEGAGVSGYSAQSTVYTAEGALYVADQVAPPAGQPWQTASLVRKFAFGRGGKVSFESSGTVRGTVINQFSMSEHGGHLRIATTDNWVSNNLYVLRSTGNQLATIGTLENLGRNERIYAVRLMGERGYIVTFRRTDPLYTLDLSNPNNPALVGELHIEGFSNYLHPLGKNHLLAVGQDADGGGRPTGFHLQIFDISNPRQPVRRFHEKLAAGSTSDSQTDHHAFMFEPATNTLSVPWKSDQYFGLLAYRVDPKEGFVNLGRVNHALMYKQYFQKICAKADVAECGNKNHWWTFVSRAAIAIDRVVSIEDQLYSMSPAGLMVHRAADRLNLTTSVLVAEPNWKPGRASIATVAEW